MQIPGLKYEGPIYRPPSEASSLLIQATVGCPWNKCTFCMVYKDGPRFKIRPVEEIKKEIRNTGQILGSSVRTLFFPSGNTIIMKAEDLAEICRYAYYIFPMLERITVYGSSQYICKKGPDGMKTLAESGLSRIHVGMESGDALVLERVRKGSTPEQHIEAGRITKAAGIELSEYVVLGLGGKERTKEHIASTVEVLNRIDPEYIRLRTFLPKVNTPILREIESGDFEVLSPHEVLRETYDLISDLEATGHIASDHYTNYASINGKMPEDREKMLGELEKIMEQNEASFRPVYVGTE